MEVKELKEFIEERFTLNDRLMDMRFENTNLQLEVVREALFENSSHHADLKDKIELLQEDLTNVKLMESEARERHALKELDKYTLSDKYSVLKVVEKYPKIILGAIAVLTGLIMSGNIESVLKIIFPMVTH